MSAPEFTVLDGAYTLRSPDGVLEWVHLRPHPSALFHHARPRWADDLPYVCTLLPSGTCYADAGGLYGPNREAWESQDPARIETAMREMWSRCGFEQEKAA